MDTGHDMHDDELRLNVSDVHTRRTRTLTHPCGTCVFRPGNPMHLPPGGLRRLVNQARDAQGYVVCHDTLPYGAYPEADPAVCRGFFDRYDTDALQLIRRLWGTTQQVPPGERVLVFVDVDGVLNPAGSRPDRAGYQRHHFTGTGPDGRPADGVVWLHLEHGHWLATLAARGAHLVWATSWGTLANTWIAPRLGLPGNWPVVDLGHRHRRGVRFGHSRKLDTIAEFAGDRAFALLDDEIGGKDHHWAAERDASGHPTLLVEVDPYQGLTRGHVERVLRWLDQHPGRGRR